MSIFFWLQIYYFIMWLIIYFIFLQLKSLKLWQYRKKRYVFYQQGREIVILIIQGREKVILINEDREKVISAGDRKKVNRAGGCGLGKSNSQIHHNFNDFKLKK